MSLMKRESTRTWDPFRELEEMSTRLNRLFGRPFAGLQENLTGFDWTPSIDVSETPTSYLVKAELPGVKKDDVHVEFDDGVLTVEGERRQEKEEKGKRFHKVERAYGKFVRRFALPTEVDGVHAKAEFKDGVLQVHLPKTATAKAKAIEVKVA